MEKNDTPNIPDKKNAEENVSEENLPKKIHWSEYFRHPAVIAIVGALFVIFGFLGFRLIKGLEEYPGMSVVDQILDSKEKLEGPEFEAFSGKAGLLRDWFFLNSALDDYGVPKQLEEVEAVGCRVVQVNGQPVAQHVVEKPPMIVSVLHGSKHGIRLPKEKEWMLLPRGDWTGAVRQDGDRVTVIALQGDESTLKHYLDSLPR